MSGGKGVNLYEIGYDEYGYFSEDSAELEKYNKKLKYVAHESDGLVSVGDMSRSKGIPNDIYRYNPKENVVVYKIERSNDGRKTYNYQKPRRK